jgi:hypothetical protein
VSTWQLVHLKCLETDSGYQLLGASALPKHTRFQNVSSALLRDSYVNFFLSGGHQCSVRRHYSRVANGAAAQPEQSGDGSDAGADSSAPTEHSARRPAASGSTCTTADAAASFTATAAAAAAGGVAEVASTTSAMSLSDAESSDTEVVMAPAAAAAAADSTEGGVPEFSAADCMQAGPEAGDVNTAAAAVAASVSTAGAAAATTAVTATAGDAAAAIGAAAAGAATAAASPAASSHDVAGASATAAAVNPVTTLAALWAPAIKPDSQQVRLYCCCC